MRQRRRAIARVLTVKLCMCRVRTARWTRTRRRCSTRLVRLPALKDVYSDSESFKGARALWLFSEVHA